MSPPEVRPSIEEVWGWLALVPDPEIPAISVVDLGIVRNVSWDEAQDCGRLVVTVTPTYSGCPATEVISASIREALEQHGVASPVIKMQLSPAWTSDWLGADAREKLRSYGIAPPAEQVIDISRISRHARPAPMIACPLCNSTNTRLTSQFGSTPCKALYQCRDCLEPFDYFKCH